MKSFLYLFLILFFTFVNAQVSMYEQEPNNDPLTGNLFNAPMIIYGTMQGNDQDLFIWDLSDVDANYFWEIELEGLPGRLTKLDVMQLNFTEDGTGVTKVNNLFSLQNYGGTSSVSLKNLIFAPGTYYLGLSYAGGNSDAASPLFGDKMLQNLGDEYVQENKNLDLIKVDDQIGYDLKIKKGTKLSHISDPSDDKEKAGTIYENRVNAVFFENNSVWLKFSIDEKGSESIWEISGNVTIGESLNLDFYDSLGELKTQVKSDNTGAYLLTDLKLTKGEYLLELISTENTMSSIQINSIGAYIEGQEQEPNDEYKFANRFDVGDKVIGQMGIANESDFYKFDVTEEMSENHLEINLSHSQEGNLTLCIYSKVNTSPLCKTQKENIQLKHIGLSAGTYVISVASGAINTKYTLEILNKGKKNSIIESEPNDTYEMATAMNPKRIIKGELSGREYDFFKFEVSEEPQTWTIQIIGDHLNYMALHSARGKLDQELKIPAGAKRAKLSNLHLLPGTHVIQVFGKQGKYILRAFPTGPYDKNFETEPNDNEVHAMLLEFDQPKKGLLNNLDDIDLYRFYLNKKQGARLSLKPPNDGSMRYYLYWEDIIVAQFVSRNGEELEYKGEFEAGEYRLQVNADKIASDDVYEIELNHYDIYDCYQDCEPNDSVYQANLIKAPMMIKGETGTHWDYDWYKLPAFESETMVSFHNNIEQSPLKIDTYLDYDQFQKTTYDKVANLSSVMIPANQESYYRINNTDIKYDFKVLINNKEVKPPIVDKNIIPTIINLVPSVQAYTQFAQNITGVLNLKNTGTQSQVIDVNSYTNDFKCEISVDVNLKNIELAAGASLSVPFNVIIPAEVDPSQKIRVTFEIKNKDHSLSKTWQEISIDSNTPLQNPEIYWSIADELLGGINVAATAFGGHRTKEDLEKNTNSIGYGFDELFDGITTNGSGMRYYGATKSNQNFITIKLAGDNAIDVEGIILNPLSNARALEYLKDFDFHLSTDGINFSSVLQGKIENITLEQSFVLPKPTPATHARLYFLSSQSDEAKSRFALGEWKVIASPKQTINSKGYNIAEPQLGGYVAWAIPQSSRQWDLNLLTEKQEKSYSHSKTDDAWQWVVGFHDQRAAKINHIQWSHPEVDVSKKDKSEIMSDVKIHVSTNSNVGPWELIAEKSLQNTSGTEDIKLASPVWARYIKFSVSSLKRNTYIYFPETIRIFEQKADETYQSILGEWGELSENAIYEKINPPQLAIKFDDKNNNTKSTAIDLSNKNKASGQVQLEYADKPDWYKYTTAAGENTLNIKLSGKLTVETVLQLEDDSGIPISYVQLQNNTNAAEYQFKVESEQDYYIKIEEPPRSVVFTWDTSPSTKSYEPIIYKAIGDYSNDVVAGRDMVNFLPFGGEFLMKEWHGEPFFLRTILNKYQRKDDSSESETALNQATKALENRQGSKSIIVITDALMNKDFKVWDSFRKVQPRVFSIGIIGNGYSDNPNRQIDLMQSWSRVNNGDFQKVIKYAEMKNAFVRVAKKLRQPADYTINVSSEFIKDAGPGKLVIQQNINQQSGGAVELILDASGSMLKRLDGKRRIDIAKEVLINTVTEIIPERTPLALRVFGDKQANACQTDLAIKLSPLERNKATNVINTIFAKNLAKTPIADSLAKVAEDLKTHKGKKVVILVTDGEETCDGNPEEVIEKLIEDGIDIRLNIVGFAIDDETLKSQFNQWSTQGGGKYFDSDNSDSLKDSVSQALKTPYSVFNKSGELVKEGVVNGENIELTAGLYTIKVYGNEVKTYENFQIKGGETQHIEIVD